MPRRLTDPNRPMSTTPPLAPRRFPARIADLGFTTTLPTDWVDHELPAEEVDFSDPTAFVPLAVVTAPHAAIVFAFAARPAHGEGTLHDWTWYHLNQQPLQPRAVGRDVVAGVAAVSGEATLASDLGPMVVRFAFFEDGDRLVQMSLTAPELFADSVRELWFTMQRSFTLETPRGSRFAIEPHADLTPAAQLPEPWLEAAPAAPVAPLVLDDRPRTRIGDFALSTDSIALDEDHETNVRLRDSGAGLVPNIAGLSDSERRATLASGAVAAQFDVPYGWHAIDDGRRVLVFEPSGRIQIHLDLLPRGGRDDSAMLDAIEAQMRADHPAPEFVRLQVGEIRALGARHLFDGTQPLEQVHMLRAFRDDTLVLRARVTATPEQAANACNLAELLLASCVFDPLPQDEAETADESPEPAAAVDDTPAPSADGRPAWWHRAAALEAAGELDAAETLLRESIPHLHFAYATADLYRLRMLRLQAAGDAAGAGDAFRRSGDFIRFYAGLATSGGEAAALSDERDAFLARLDAEYRGAVRHVR